MRKLAIVAALLAFAAPSLAAEGAGQAGADPMKDWKPPKVTNEKKDRAEINALMKKMDDAGKAGDLAAVMALIDFPVLMTTDSSKGEAMSAAWSAEQYRKEMEPFFKPNSGHTVKHKTNVFLMSDSLATVNDETTVTMGKKPITTKNSTLLIRTGGQWKIKAMTEGGWGSMMGGDHAASSQKGPGDSVEPASGEPARTTPSAAPTPGATDGAAETAPPTTR